MSCNGNSPTLDDVYEVLGREQGKHPILLHINAGQKGPLWAGWSKVTYERTLSPKYQSLLRKKTNTGVLLGVTDDLCTIDFDTDAALGAFLEENPPFKATLRTRGASGAQCWFYSLGERPHKIESLKVKKDSPLAAHAREAADNEGYISIGEFRAEGGQSVIRGIHPDSFNYTWAEPSPPITIAFASIRWPNDIRLPWAPKRAKTKATTANAAHDEDLLHHAIAALTVDFLWSHFSYPERRKNPVQSPWFPNDKDTSFSIYNEGRNFKDHDPSRPDHRGDSFTFYQLATGKTASEAFSDFVTLAGLGDQLNQNRKPKPKRTKASDPRPIIMHPNDDSYISDFAHELAAILKTQAFYRYNGRAVQVRDVIVKGRNGKEHQIKKLVELTVPIFSTIIENYCRPMRRRGKNLLHESITLEIAARTLVCLDFVLGLPEIKLWTDVRLPIRRGEAIVLTQPGYDPISGVYTSPDAPVVDETLTIEEADQKWRSLMAEFCFPQSGKTEKEEPDERKREPERERAIAVALAAALTPLSIYLLPEKSHRPAFGVTANSEGAGKTLLLSFGMVAKLGFVPTGNAPSGSHGEDEMRKILDGAVHYAVPIIFFDNLKGHLSSGQLEAFITSTTRSYRLLGTTNYNEGENLSTVYLTANFATYSPDLRRRLLAVELILEEARAEERIIKNYLDEDALIRRRSELLSIFWTFIRYWHENGEASATKLLPSFEAWSAVVAGIVEAGGYSSPCQLAILKTGGDTDTQDIEKLISAMVPNSEYRFSDLIDLVRDHSLFPRLVPEQGDPERWQSTRLGVIIRKFVGRIFSIPNTDDTGKITTTAYRLSLSGDTQKTRRYFIIKV